MGSADVVLGSRFRILLRDYHDRASGWDPGASHRSKYYADGSLRDQEVRATLSGPYRVLRHLEYRLREWGVRCRMPENGWAGARACQRVRHCQAGRSVATMSLKTASSEERGL